MAQSKSARFRTSVAQHWGVPELQRPSWRSSRGAAKAATAKARTVVKSMLIAGWLMIVVEVEEGGLSEDWLVD